MVAFKKLLCEEEGQGLVEYALIVALISVVAIAAMRLMGTQIQTLFGNVSTDLQDAGN